MKSTRDKYPPEDLRYRRDPEDVDEKLLLVGFLLGLLAGLFVLVFAVLLYWI